jgi:hypothetical protein
VIAKRTLVADCLRAAILALLVLKKLRTERNLYMEALYLVTCSVASGAVLSSRWLCLVRAGISIAQGRSFTSDSSGDSSSKVASGDAGASNHERAARVYTGAYGKVTECWLSRLLVYMDQNFTPTKLSEHCR